MASCDAIPLGVSATSGRLTSVEEWARYDRPARPCCGRRLVNALLRFRDAKGLFDMIMPARMGSHLADSFEACLGDDAPKYAQRFAQ